jgi:uncharacterized protein YjbI with pentapeptide repeats
MKNEIFRIFLIKSSVVGIYDGIGQSGGQRSVWSLNDVDFTNTILKGVDISTCTFEQINVSPESLVGCEVSSNQAIGFSRLLGLKIKE